MTEMENLEQSTMEVTTMDYQGWTIERVFCNASGHRFFGQWVYEATRTPFAHLLFESEADARAHIDQLRAHLAGIKGANHNRL